jgi:hypothetical protein
MKSKKTTPAIAKITRKNTPMKNDVVVKPKTYIYKVESGVIISGSRKAYDEHQFPFELMKPGDSFLIPATDKIAKSPNVLHYAAKQYARMKPGFTITSRMQLDKARRVWRLK